MCNYLFSYTIIDSLKTCLLTFYTDNEIKTWNNKIRKTFTSQYNPPHGLRKSGHLRRHLISVGEEQKRKGTTAKPPQFCLNRSLNYELELIVFCSLKKNGIIYKTRSQNRFDKGLKFLMEWNGKPGLYIQR